DIVTLHQAGAGRDVQAVARRVEHQVAIVSNGDEIRAGIVDDDAALGAVEAVGPVGGGKRLRSAGGEGNGESVAAVVAGGEGVVGREDTRGGTAEVDGAAVAGRKVGRRGI